jgi:multidrug efflux pump subunit AcrB
VARRRRGRQAQLVGLTLDDIAGQFQAALDGRRGGQVLEDLEDLPVRIRYADAARNSPDAISTLRLNTGEGGTWLPASALGDLRLAPELRGITRRNGERVNEISAYLRQGALPIEVTRAVLGRSRPGPSPCRRATASKPPGTVPSSSGPSASCWSTRRCWRP